LLKPILLPVALVTVFSRNFSITKDSVGVAFVTGETVIENKRVIESCVFIVDKGVFCMAMGTIIYLGIVLAFFEMADEAGAFSDRDVLSLNDLGVAACALEAFPPF